MRSTYSGSRPAWRGSPGRSVRCWNWMSAGDALGGAVSTSRSAYTGAAHAATTTVGTAAHNAINRPIIAPPFQAARCEDEGFLQIMQEGRRFLPKVRAGANFRTTGGPKCALGF